MEIINFVSGLSRDPSGDRLTLARSGQIPRSESRMSAASGVSGLPDLELDLNIPAVRDMSGDRAVHRTVSLLVSGVDMDTPADLEPQLDVVAKREEVLREIEEKKLQIREAKGEHPSFISNTIISCFSLDSEWINDSGGFWRDGLSANAGVSRALELLDLHPCVLIIKIIFNVLQTVTFYTCSCFCYNHTYTF